MSLRHPVPAPPRVVCILLRLQCVHHISVTLVLLYYIHEFTIVFIILLLPAPARDRGYLRPNPSASRGKRFPNPCSSFYDADSPSTGALAAAAPDIDMRV